MKDSFTLYEKGLLDLAKRAASYGERLRPPCSPAQLDRLRDESRRNLVVAVPDPYARFLELHNGLDWNGLLRPRLIEVGGDERSLESSNRSGGTRLWREGYQGGPMAPVTVPADAPPLFVDLAAADPLLGNGGFGLIDSWRAARKPVELHVHEQGGHGSGMYAKETTSTGWFDAFVSRRTTHGMLKPKAESRVGGGAQRALGRPLRSRSVGWRRRAGAAGRPAGSVRGGCHIRMTSYVVSAAISSGAPSSEGRLMQLGEVVIPKSGLWSAAFRAPFEHDSIMLFSADARRIHFSSSRSGALGIWSAERYADERPEPKCRRDDHRGFPPRNHFSKAESK